MQSGKTSSLKTPVRNGTVAEVANTNEVGSTVGVTQTEMIASKSKTLSNVRPSGVETRLYRALTEGKPAFGMKLVGRLRGLWAIDNNANSS